MRFTFEDLVSVMARLRGPDGCPWDREQTHASLAPYLLEEAHEVLEAISRADTAALREELGDLLLQVVFHGQMAREAGGFAAGDVVDGLTRKLIDRHPHVFGDGRLGTPAEVLAQWHELKRREAPERGAFDGIPPSLPALARAQKLLARAAANEDNGALRPDVARLAREIHSELDGLLEVQEPPAEAKASTVPDRLGELLFAVVALAATLGADAEAALRNTCERFADRPARSSDRT